MDELSRLTTALAERYQIEREIGKGGMATVYLARDVRHDRRVALKLLNPELGAVLGVARFLSEIRVTANLQHPNLLPLFDSGEADGLLFYVMPYVEGETLRDRLMRERQLSTDEALHIATVVAGALDYAHRHGVIHRDLKPENILLHDGQPLLADFGIALAVSNAGGARITQTGLSLGTPQYMSPEQATGDRAIDGRTDIYSLGAVTYEMLTGEPPHTASTAQGVIARLMVEVPRSMTVLRPSVPPHVDIAVRHALEKLPADRFATAHEFADALTAKGDARLEPARGSTSRWRFAAVGLIGLAALCALAATIERSKLAHLDALQAYHFKLDVPDGQQVVLELGAPIAISPDGGTVAYSGTGPAEPLLYVRRFDGLETSQFRAGERQADIMFSPDGRRISFVSSSTGERLDWISVAGGPLTTIAHPHSLHGANWSPDGKLVFADSGALWRVDAPGATRKKIFAITVRRAGDDVFLPFVLPNGKDVMFWTFDSKGYHLAMVSMNGTNLTVFEEVFGNPLRYLDGWLIYGREGGAVMARKFDQSARAFSGDAITLLEGATWQDAGGVEASISANGTLAYIRGNPNSTLQVLDRHGVPTQSAAVAGAYSNPVWSPDGKRIAIEKRFAGSEKGSIWIYDVASNALSLLTTPSTDAGRPTWMADGKRVAFAYSGPADSAIGSVPWDLSGPEKPLYAATGLRLREVAFSADGNYAVLRTDNADRTTKADLEILPLKQAGGGKLMPLVESVAQEEMPSISPDSHWLAYQSNETGRYEIYVRPFPGGGSRVLVSTDGGSEPRWMAGSTQVVYRAPHAFWSATLSTTTGNSQVVRRDSLFADLYTRTDNHQGYDIAPDGRVAIFRPAGDVEIVVITNWWSEARAKLPPQ